MSLPKDKMKKALVIYATEQSLIDIGGIRLYDKVTEFLRTKFNATIPDCYEHPEYLHKSLHDLYGKSAQEIIKTIQSNLKEFDYQEPIHNFIKKIA